MAETAPTYPIVYKPWTGRPPKYQPHEIEEKLVEYAILCEKTGRIPNVPEFQTFIDVCSDTWEAYKAHKNKLFVRAIKRVENWIEAGVVGSGLLNNVAGQIFYLKNKHGYADKREINHTGQVKHAHLHAELDTKLNGMLLGDNAPAVGEIEQDAAIDGVCDDCT